MTPAARVAAAIDLMDEILEGTAAEAALTAWARGNRYAGSGDRHAIRDLVFDALRALRSNAARGAGIDFMAGAVATFEGVTGRHVMIGALAGQGLDLDTYFTGETYAPEGLSPVEVDALDMPPIEDAGVRYDLPDWLVPGFEDALGDDLGATCELLRQRAPVFLRVNQGRTTRAKAAEKLALEGIETKEHPLSPWALEVITNPRKVAQGRVYQDGLVELQDAASTALVDLLPLPAGGRVLDFCAGGGGKSLAMAARVQAENLNPILSAYDIDFKRMSDIDVRAERARSVQIDLLRSSQLRRDYDLILADAPCSGSGSWRRAPHAKWMLTPDRLDELTRIQAEILMDAADRLAPKGILAYATCSVLAVENRNQIDGFLAARTDFSLKSDHVFRPLDGGDGFYLAILQKQT